jgi:phosphate/sulfate permease
MEQENTLKSWATGKLAMFAIGLAVGYFIYKSGLIQKVSNKLFAKKED